MNGDAVDFFGFFHRDPRHLGGFLSHRATPSYHPFLDGISLTKTSYHPFLDGISLTATNHFGDPPLMVTAPAGFLGQVGGGATHECVTASGCRLESFGQVGHGAGRQVDQVGMGKRSIDGRCSIIIYYGL